MHWIVVYACTAIRGAGENYLQHRANEGESPVCDLHTSIYGVHCSSNVPLEWNANGCHISSKCWHMSETDRKHVPWGSCEKNFENIVIRTCPRCSSMDIVCGYGKIVTGAVINNCAKETCCVCTAWCIFLRMWTIVRYVGQRCVVCSHSHTWRMHIMKCHIAQSAQTAASCACRLSRCRCASVYMWCMWMVVLVACGYNMLMFYPSWNTDQGVYCVCKFAIAIIQCTMNVIIYMLSYVAGEIL